VAQMAETDINGITDYDESDGDESPFTKKGDRAKREAGEQTFQNMLLKDGILKAIGECGFEYPSAVQRHCIPQAILTTDILCQAKSGMGKTAVFVLSILNLIEPEEDRKHLLALILCHTRELALQIQKEFHRFQKHLPNVVTSVVVGGVPYNAQKESLKQAKPNIVIATPGTFLRILKEKEKVLDLSQLKFFVIDECDQIMESLELRKDTQDIFRLTPVQKQVMMFTATLSEQTQQLCRRFMRHPHEVLINDGAKLTLEGLHQYFVTIAEQGKIRKIIDLLDQLQFNQCMIFVKSVLRAENLHQILTKESFPTIACYGKLKQKQRLEVYTKFKETKTPIMICTDIFARGIDFERVNVVINFDMPLTEDIYLHRVGRAGRYGTKGVTVSFVTSDEDKKVLAKVREKYSVDLPELPATIDPNLYR